MTVELVGVGLGGVARPELEHLDGLPDVSVVAGADVDADARDWFEAAFDAPAYESHEALLAEWGDRADAACVVTPHAFHREQVLACLAAGLHVYVEKPMVVGVEAAVEVCAAARERDRVVQVGYQRHFHPLFAELREVVRSGRIGDPRFVSCYLEQDWIGPQSGTWRTAPDVAGGGQLYDSGSHLLDVLLWTTDAEPREVAAVVERGDRDVDVDSALAVRLERAGRSVTASVGVTADGPTHPDTGERLVVVGTGGKAEYAPGELVVTERGEEPGDVTVTTHTESVDDGEVFLAKLDDFVGAVREGREPAVPPETALAVTALTEAAYRASERGERVDVDALLAAAREAVGAPAR